MLDYGGFHFGAISSSFSILLFILYNIFISSVIIYNIENDLFMHLMVINIALNINILIRIYQDNF